MGSAFIKRGFLRALGVLAYVSALALLLSNAEHLFKNVPEIAIAIFMMTLFIVSATTTASLVLWSPAVFFAQGKYGDALRLLIATVGWLVCALVVGGFGMAILL